MASIIPFPTREAVNPKALDGRVICLSGWKGSGKDTIADHLVRHYGFRKLSFAAALKDMVAAQYQIPRVDLDHRVLKEASLPQYPVITTDATTRAIHQLLATELSSGYWTPRALCILEGSLKRAVSANYWVNRVAQTIAANPTGKFVISDMRYRSEADSIRALLGERAITMRVSRFSTIDTLDPSERDLDNYQFDMHVDNSGSPEQLLSVVDWMLAHLSSGRKAE